MRKRIILFVATCAGLTMVLNSCGPNEDAKSLDDTLFEESTASGLTYYQNGNILDGKAPSPHGSFKLAYNDVAAAALDSEGELPVGASFPKGSLLVKEVYKDGQLDLIVPMKKDAGSEFAGGDWLWGEYGTDGSVVYSVGEKGKSCTGCHGGSPNRDLVRTYDLH
jgi:hypothetical protein